MSTKRTKNKSNSKSTANYSYIKDQLLALFYANQPKDFSHKQIAKKLGLQDKKSRQALTEILDKLSNSGEVQQLRNGNFKSEEGEPNYITGVVDYVNPRFAFIVSAESEEDIRVKTEDLLNALDGDKVKAVVFGKAKGDGRLEGSVVEVLERKREEFVGKIEISNRYAFVVPDSRKMHFDIFVKLEDIKEAKNKDKVIVRITEWPDPQKGKDENPTGEVLAVLGPAGDNEAEIHSIMAEFGLPFAFPEEIETAADKISTKITKAEIGKRRDMRDVTTFTIDPADAKDFDDALSITYLENGNYEIGVHIADVSHYVKPGSILEEEALNRATSVYLVDRTIPMLPEKLSNNLCSLRPNEDKLTFSAVFEIDTNAKVLNQWFGRTITHSDHRFSYEEAQERIESVAGEYAKEITILNELALKLRANRFMKGAINFETVEVKFRLDEKGKPLEVIPKVRKDAHKMIEEFMLLANKKVAEYVYSMTKGKGKPGSKNASNTFVYRIHDYPDPEKLNTFSVFAKKFGHTLKVDENAIAKSMNKLIDDIEGRPEQNVLESLAIRTMAKAKYTTETKGHFGLAFDHYTHFTSPIRRYPDVMVHRLLQHYLDKGKSVSKEDYEEKCVHSSEREKRAADAERASIKYKQVEFMQSMLNEDFDGLVSGITEWGVFVEIVETKCEGMVRMSEMTDDYYEFDEKNYRIIGRKNKKIITLGDQVRVKVVKTDVDRRTIDLQFVK